MTEFQVNCITKSSAQGGNEHITHIGNSSAKWCLTREAAIERIERKTDPESYYTLDGKTGKKAYIGVVRPEKGTPYLRSHADSTWNDNLLAQATCGGECKLIQ